MRRRVHLDLPRGTVVRTSSKMWTNRHALTSVPAGSIGHVIDRSGYGFEGWPSLTQRVLVRTYPRVEGGPEGSGGFSIMQPVDVWVNERAVTVVCGPLCARSSYQR